MSLLAGINLVMGLAGTAAANREASRAARAAKAERDMAISAAKADDAARMKWYQDAVASGQFSPDEALKLADETVGTELRSQVGNLQGGLLAKGYAPGSSNIEQGSRNLSESARLKLAAMKQGIRTDSQSRQMNAMNFAAPRSTGMILNQANTDQARADQSRVNPAGLLTGAMSSGGDIFDFLRKAKKTDSGAVDSYAQAKMDMNPNHQYDRYGNLVF